MELIPVAIVGSVIGSYLLIGGMKRREFGPLAAGAVLLIVAGVIALVFWVVIGTHGTS